MKKLIVLASILLINLTLVFGQSAISGQVLDSESNTPLPGANIIVDGTNKGAVSDNNGYFRITNFESDIYDVTVTYIGYQESTISVDLTNNQVVSPKILLDPTVLAGDDIVVIGDMLRGQARALNQQKNAMNITNIVAADQIGQFPDANIGDALKRLPGVTVFNDQGEARFGVVRGTQPRFNSVLINGERIPSAEAESRSIQLDLIPTDMIQTIKVNKALTPDMDADAIGGSINLVTKSAPTSQKISLSAAGGWNFLEEAGLKSKLSALYANRFADDKLGVIVNLTHHNHHLGSDNIEAEWKGEDELGEMDVRKYLVQRTRRSGSVNLDYVLNDNNTIFLNTLYNWRDDWENRFRLRYTDLDEDESQIRRQTKAGTDGRNKYARLEDQRMYSASLGGKHIFGDMNADWVLAFSQASEDRPNERYISIRAKDQQLNQNLDDTNYPLVTAEAGMQDLSNNGEWSLKEITEEFQWTYDRDINFKLDLSYPVSQKITTKFGGKMINKTKERENEFYEFEPIDEDAFLNDALSNIEDQTKDEFLPGEQYESGSFVTPEFLGGLDLDDESKFEKEEVVEEIVGNFDATETIIAAYGMATVSVTEQITALVGARFELTKNEYNAFVFDADEETIEPVSSDPEDYNNILPYVHLLYNINDNTNVRAAYTQSLARPNYFDLAPYREIVQEDEEIKEGNPALVPTMSSNFDLLFESYFSNIGIVSFGVFQKSITDFIITEKTTDATTGYDLYHPINGGDASLIGVEVALQRQLDFIPGLGIYLNYTYNQSKIENFQIEDRESDDLPLPGSPEHSFNGSLSYEYGPVSVRLSANYHSDYIDPDEGAISDDTFEDRYYDEALHVDINGSYQITESLQFYFKANNLTNQPLRYYQGEKDFLSQEEWYNRKITAGLKFNL